MKYVALFFCLFILSCSSDDDAADEGFICTEEFVYGLQVTVNDASTGSGLADVVITAREPGYSEILQATGTVGVYVGAGEREGSYTLTVEREGYQTVVTDVITVTSDECHVIPQTRTFTLAPL